MRIIKVHVTGISFTVWPDEGIPTADLLLSSQKFICHLKSKDFNKAQMYFSTIKHF